MSLVIIISIVVAIIVLLASYYYMYVGCPQSQRLTKKLDLSGYPACNKKFDLIHCGKDVKAECAHEGGYFSPGGCYTCKSFY